MYRFLEDDSKATRDAQHGIMNMHPYTMIGYGVYAQYGIMNMHPYTMIGKGKPDSNSKGQISEAMITARLLQAGYIVLTPYGGTQRYDFIIEDTDRNLWRIQCKSAWIDEDGTVLKFDTANHNVTGKKGIGGTIEEIVNTLLYTVQNLIRSI